MFLLALVLRLGFVLIANEPPLYAHPYHYYRGAFQIVEHPEPLRYIFTSDEWRAWGGVWTLAPLYFVFLAGVLELFGPDRLLPVHVVQCVLEAGTAVLVAALGRALAGPRAVWAGVAYALYWPAVELPSRLLTENVQTVLLVGAIVALARGAAADTGRRAIGWTMAGGLLLGVSALARAVGFAFLPLAALWRFALALRRRRAEPWTLRARHAVVPAAVMIAAVMLPIAPWWARNALVMHDPSPIESVSVYNVWANYAFVNEGRFAVQQLMINKETDAAGRRARAMGVRLARDHAAAGRVPGEGVDQLPPLPPSRGAAHAADPAAGAASLGPLDRGPPRGPAAAARAARVPGLRPGRPPLARRAG